MLYHNDVINVLQRDRKSKFQFFLAEGYLLKPPDVFLGEWRKLVLKYLAMLLFLQERYDQTDVQVNFSM